MKFIVYGAGAVGSVLGGMLSLNHHDVCLVGRDAPTDAVNREGLRLKSATAEYHAHPLASTVIPPDATPGTDCVLVAVKTQDLSAAIDTIAPMFAPDTPVICLQNGIVAEETASARFAHVFGGVVRMTCSMVQPGHVSFQNSGRVIVGKYPKGTDAFARTVATAISEAGFDAVASRDIMADKWLKLAVNVQSGFHAVIDARDHDTNEFHALKLGILEETRRVFKAAKIRARSCDGKDPSIEDMMETLRRPQARRVEHGVKLRNSVWQDLYLKRPSVEAEFIHGPVIELGRTQGVSTPYNRASLDVVQRCHREGLGPESVRLSEVAALVDRYGKAK